MRTTMIARWIAALVSVFYLVGGAWAMLAPRSFFDTVATFRPLNEHFIHDIGAFQLGLALMLLLALAWRNGLKVALVANAVAAIAHAGSHYIDRDAGGRSTDPIVFGVMALLLVAAAVMAGDESHAAHTASSRQ